jgi:hypothetical protein
MFSVRLTPTLVSDRLRPRSASLTLPSEPLNLFPYSSVHHRHQSFDLELVLFCFKPCIRASISACSSSSLGRPSPSRCHSVQLPRLCLQQP